MFLSISYNRNFPVVSLCVISVFASFTLAAQSTKHGAITHEIVTVIDGSEYTAADINQLRASLPPPFKQSTSTMDNGTFIRVYAELLGFAKKAEEIGLPEKEPFRTQLQFNRLNYLAQLYLQRLTERISITAGDYKTYYDTHRSNYEDRAVSGIYIDYSSDAKSSATGSKKQVLSENEARLKIKNLLKQLEQGADFAELARVHSTDATSAKKGGELGRFRYDTKIPATLRDAIFSVEPGHFSEAQQHGGRFYIFHVTDIKAQPLDQVKSQITSKIRAQKLTQMIDEIRASITIKTINEAYMTRKPGDLVDKTNPRFGTKVQIPVPPKP